MSHSKLAIKRGIEFDNYFNMNATERKKVKNINAKNKLAKFVYYYGLPNNENCDEYFSEEEKVLTWIKRNIYYNINVNLEYAKISLDYFNLNWEITFSQTLTQSWFIGTVLMSNSKIYMPCKNFVIEIVKFNNNICNNEFSYKTIKFIGPLIQLQSLFTENNTTYILNVGWNNSNAVKITNPNYTEVIECNYYELHVLSKDYNELRAILISK